MTHFSPTWDCSFFRLKQPVQDQYASAICPAFDAAEKCLQGHRPSVGSERSGRPRRAEGWGARMIGHSPRRQVPNTVAEQAEVEVP